MDGDNWRHKQDRLQAFLDTHGAGTAPYRVDLAEQKLYWVDTFGLSLVVADCKVLLSYAHSNRSVMMAWANSSLAPGSAIDRLEGFHDFYSDFTPEDVWLLASDCGSLVEAEALYRAPSPQSWVMLGLWNLRPGGPEQFHSASPKLHVQTVLKRLISHPYLAELTVLLDNYAESFLQLAGHTHKTTEFEAPLKDTARAMRNFLSLANEEQLESLRDGLKQLEATWDALP